MNDVDLAYMAGVFDGEGCICIGRNSERNTYSLTCQINLTKEYIPNLFQFYFGGRVSPIDMAIGNSNWKPEWSWVVCSRKASAFLEIISPYLRLKKAEAELGIAFQRRKGLRGIKQTREAKALEEAQFILMRNLKKGGVIDEKANSF